MLRKSKNNNRQFKMRTSSDWKGSGWYRFMGISGKTFPFQSLKSKFFFRCKANPLNTLSHQICPNAYVLSAIFSKCFASCKPSHIGLKVCCVNYSQLLNLGKFLYPWNRSIPYTKNQKIIYIQEQWCQRLVGNGNQHIIDVVQKYQVLKRMSF